MSRHKEQSFDEPRYIRPKNNAGSVRRYKLVSEGEMEPGSNGWQMTLGFISDIAGGGEATIAIHARSKEKLKGVLGKIRTVEELERTALSQYRSGDLSRADFNREQAVRLRSELVEQDAIMDLPLREWRWENNQLIFRGQQKMF